MTEHDTPQYRSPLLSRPGAVAATGVDTGVALHYGNPVAEGRALSAGKGILDLSHQDVVLVAGPDRLTWLNSITSQNMLNIGADDGYELLVLDTKGHIEYAAAAADDGDTTWLMVESGRGEPLTAWLQSMQFAMRVEVSHVSDEWATIGVVSPEDFDDVITTLQDACEIAMDWLDPWPGITEGGTSYYPVADGSGTGGSGTDHPGAEHKWYRLVILRDELEDAVAGLEKDGFQLVGSWASEAERIAALRPRWGTEVDERTIAHELDWLRTAVHMDKGCYRGQETIARVHNLGRPPRRLVFLDIDGSQAILPEPGAEIYALPEGSAELGRPVGRVTSSSRHHELGHIALALIKRSVPVDQVLVIPVDSEMLTATQTEVVSQSGEPITRPAPRPETLREVGRRPGGGLAGMPGAFG